MLTAEQNAELTRVGPGTPMGELLRRYWYPVGLHPPAGGVPGQAGAAARRGLGSVQDPGRVLRGGRGAVPAPAGVAGLRGRRGRGAALRLPRLAVRPRRDLP